MGSLDKEGRDKVRAFRDLVQDLMRPDALPHPTGRVELVQTHISWVFLTDEFAYKVKKPVNFGFLDFTTPQLRRHFCHEEVRLNRRLSGDLYLGVLPIYLSERGYSFTQRHGEPVEHAVWMRRIPEESLMKRMLLRGELRGEHLWRIAEVLADFFSRAESSEEINTFGEPQRFKVNTDENFFQIEPYQGKTISVEDLRFLRGWTERFYETQENIFWDRIRKAKIRDCHGDLHMEHISIGERVSIFDCIEFNQRFRYGDTLSDIAFLLMDLEFHGAETMAEEFWKAYKSLAKEEDVEDLLRFYKVYRAIVRAKVNGFQLEDPTIGPDEKKEALKRARAYFRLALSYLGRTP